MRKIIALRAILALLLISSSSLFSLGNIALATQDYVIAVDDVVDVNVLKDDTLTKTLTVDEDGSITLPYINKVKISGLNCKEAANLIAERLKAGNFLVEPKVTVSVKEFLGQKVMVFGLVKTPGIQYLSDKTTVLDLIKQVEISPEAKNGKMIITRKYSSGDKAIDIDLASLILKGDLSQNILILPGDSIVISAKDPLPLQSSDDEYVIAAEDVLDINVWKDENLTKVLPVGDDGSITLPYINNIKVAGLTCKEAENFIAERLKSGNFLIDPKVTVLVKEFRGQRVMVFGLVKKPGVYYLKGKTYCLDLLAEVGDTEKSKGGKLTITRKDNLGEQEVINVDLHSLLMNGDLSQNIQILPGDSIVISLKSTGQQVYVLGEVRVPGPYTIQRDLSVLEALRMAGGQTDFANRSKVKIIREENGKKKNIFVNLDKIKKGDKDEDITLQAGDVLVSLKSWF